MNINNIISSSLNFINPMQNAVLTRSETVWVVEEREPQVITKTVTLKVRLQPADDAKIAKLGLNFTDYKYFKGYVSYPVEGISDLEQFKGDTFQIGNQTYRVVGHMAWNNQGWSEFYCYLDDLKEEEIEGETASETF